MNLYETTFIVNPQTDDATIDRHVRDVADVITRNQGQIRFEDHMGTRRLAYEIQGLTQGYYASFIFEAPPAVLPQLERHYKLNEQYIRHLTVRFEGNLEKLTQRVQPETEKKEDRPVKEAAAPAKAPEAEETAVVEEEEEKPAAEVEADTAEIETVDESTEPEADDTTAESSTEDEEL